MTADPCRPIEKRLERVGVLSEAQAILHWDLATQMPSGGATARGEQLAALAAAQHDLLIAPAAGEELAAAESDLHLDPWARANLALGRRLRTRALAVPSNLVAARARAETVCEQTWRQARSARSFALVADPLARLFDLVREEARAIGDALGLAPYDALLDGYHRGGRAAAIEPLFDELARTLPPLIERIEERQAGRPSPRLPAEPVAPDRQRALARWLMERLGFDFDHGRLDESAHPFCGGTPDDVRITMRIDPLDPLSGVMAVLHETGHALYERGLPARWRRQPVGQANGMAIHESQSLLVEMQVARSPAFARFLAPACVEAFGWPAASVTPDAFGALLRRVRRSLIRVDADEATYPLHVVMRFRIERALVEGGLAVGDLPAAWADAQAAVLGLRPGHDAEGCLQDIHWFGGAIGYFPTYTLGAMAAAQLFTAARVALGGIEDAMAAGDLAPLMRWLGERIHCRGSLETPDRLIEEATGRPLDAMALLNHLQARYLA